MAKVTLHKDDDPEIVAAGKTARGKFRYFWRELSWEYRRIVPGLDVAAFKVPFSDGDEDDTTEVMWVSDVNFDGYKLSGVLLNEPNWLKTVHQGDKVKVPVKSIVDWIYALEGRVYGGFTVNAIRSKMGKKERKAHDAAWGLEFGDPSQVHVVPPDWFNEKPKAGFFSKMFAKPLAPVEEKLLQTNEHPMAANMADSLAEFFKKKPGVVNEVQENGLNMFHQLVLAGTTVGAKTALKHGADINGKSARGHTALAFAKSLGWKKVAMLLEKNGGK